MAKKNSTIILTLGIRLIRTVELDQTKNYIFGSHPHGLLCSGMFGAFATEGADVGKLFPNFKGGVPNFTK